MSFKNRVLVAGLFFFSFFHQTLPASADFDTDCGTLRGAIDFVLKDHLVFRNFNSELSKRTEQFFYERVMTQRQLFTQKTLNAINFAHGLNLANPYLFKTQIERADCSYLFNQISLVSKAYLDVSELLGTPESLQKRVLALARSGKRSPINYSRVPKTIEVIADRFIRALANETLDYKEVYSEMDGEKEISIEDIAMQVVKSFFHLFHKVEKSFPRMPETYFLKSFADALDPHSEYFDEEESTTFFERTSGQFAGVGIIFGRHPFGVKVSSVTKGGSADRGGIPVGAVLTQVDGQDIQGVSIEDVRGKIRGEPNSILHVRYGILRAGKIENQQDVYLIREELAMSSAGDPIATRVEAAGKSILVIKFGSFYGGVTSAVNQALVTEQKRAPVDAVLLDLRGNPGGLLSEAVSLVGLFIPRGAVVGRKNAEGNDRVHSDLASYVAYKGPLAVAIDELTASASEVVAGTLSDYSRAIVLGANHSFGKGTVQTPLSGPEARVYLPHGTFKVTTDMYFTAGGSSPQFQGVRSDVEIPSRKRVASYLREKDRKYAIKPLVWTGPLYDPEDKKEVRNPYRVEQVQELKKLFKVRTKRNAAFQKYLRTKESSGDIQLSEILNITTDYVDLQTK